MGQDLAGEGRAVAGIREAVPVPEIAGLALAPAVRIAAANAGALLVDGEPDGTFAETCCGIRGTAPFSRAKGRGPGFEAPMERLRCHAREGSWGSRHLGRSVRGRWPGGGCR